MLSLLLVQLLFLRRRLSFLSALSAQLFDRPPDFVFVNDRVATTGTIVPIGQLQPIEDAIRVEGMMALRTGMGNIVVVVRVQAAETDRTHG